MIRLRGFRKQDLPRLYELDQACFASGIAYSTADLRYFLANPRSFCFLAEDDADHLAGFILVERLRRSGVMTGHVITIDVDPGMRRQGVGSVLLKAAEARLREEGIAQFLLEVAVDNSAAQAFYRRFGFTAIGYIPNYYAGKLAAQVMQKDL